MRQKRIKGMIAGIVLLLMIAAGIRHAHFQSVDSYQKEQEQLAESLDIGQPPSEASDIEGAEDKVSLPFQSEDVGESQGEKGADGTGGIGKKSGDGGAEDTGKGAGDNRADNQDSVSTGNSKGDKASSHSHKDSSQAGSKNQAESGKSGTGYGGSGDSFEGGTFAASSKPAQESKDEAPVASAPQQEGKTPMPKDEKITCTIEISCSSLLENKSSVDESILKYIPRDGQILPRTSLSVEKGASVYDVLAQVCKAKDIAIDAQYTPMYKSYYLRGIGHIYEKQAGDRSGWIYEVNGVSPNRGASSCRVAEGDVICWQYTCDGKNT